LVELFFIATLVITTEKKVKQIKFYNLNILGYIEISAFAIIFALFLTAKIQTLTTH